MQFSPKQTINLITIKKISKLIQDLKRNKQITDINLTISQKRFLWCVAKIQYYKNT